MTVVIAGYFGLISFGCTLELAYASTMEESKNAQAIFEEDLGYTATRKIREFNQNIPIIALTASAIVDIEQKKFDAGMQDLVTRPLILTICFSKSLLRLRRLHSHNKRKDYL
jgi:PleD family two-component response regulator